MSDSYKHLVGRVGTDPVRKPTPAGELAEFRLAVDGEYDPATKTRPTEWYDATAWEPMDLVVAGNFKVGSRVWVAGPTSVYKGATGDRLKVKVRECGLVERLVPVARTLSTASTKAAPKAKAAPPEGVEYDTDDEAEW